MEESLAKKKRVRDEPEELELELPEVKRLKENLLDSFDDDDDEFCTVGQDLDSFMKSFEEEITASPSAAVGEAEVVDVRAECGESRPDLGYLLEASDDELGLPPTSSSSGVVDTELRAELERVGSNSSELGSEFWEIPSFDDPFGSGFGFSGAENNDGGDGDYAALDGLFDYSDMGFGSTDIGWRAETLPAQ